MPLAIALRQHLPERLADRRVRLTVDLPENRFVKAFLRHATAIVGQVRAALSEIGDPLARRAIEADCHAIDTALRPIVAHRMWEDVGVLDRVPAESTVLQRKRGYREIFRHHVRLRSAPRIPLTVSDAQRMLALKDIALLYEIWCFFQVEAAVTHALGRAPTRATEGRTRSAPTLQHQLPWDLELVWPDGTKLYYNPRFSRSRPEARRSYSLALRPDIVLQVPSGPAAGLHLFDAKFRVDQLPPLAADDEADDAVAAERRGAFKNADLYKMHTYRDAIPNARSVWILYPGTERRWYSADQQGLDGRLDGVGAIPMSPSAQRSSMHDASHLDLALVVRAALGADRLI